MVMHKSMMKTKRIVFIACFFFTNGLYAVFPNTCPILQKRNNGNGGWAACAGQGGVPVASNVVGTPYANFFSRYSILPRNKTGDINFYWPGRTDITKLYVITRVWVGTTLLPTRVGPPPVPTVRNGNTYATYCFYVANLPTAGVLTLEFTDPQTGIPAYRCSYDLKTGASVTIAVPCAPTIYTQPQSQTICGNSASFTVEAAGVVSYQWQMSSNGGSSWSNVTGTDFTGVTTPTLNIANAASYSGYQFRVVLTGAATCGNTTSAISTLTAYPLPTASFAAGALVCGVGTVNLRVNFTGTGPWSFTYTTNGSSPVTVSNIASNPYFMAVSPTVTTTYGITAVNDRFCANNLASSPVTIIVQQKPTITLSGSSVNYCYNASAGVASLNYSSTSSNPNVYSISAGARAMPGFSVINNASLAASPISINIPAGTTPGTYDFNLRVALTTPSPGCASDNVPFTVVVRPNPPLTVSASPPAVCPGSSSTLSASPNLGAGYTYNWTSSPAGFTSSVAAPLASPSSTTTYTVTVTETATGCISTGMVTVTMKPLPSVAVNNPTICSGDRAVLTASGAASYSWTLSPSGSASSTLSSITGSTVLANPTTTTTYRVTGTNTQGCSATADATVTVSPAVTVSVTPSTSVCRGSSVSLTASGATTYSWAPVSSLSSGTGATVTATPAATTTYNVTGSNGTCFGSASTTITVTDPVSVAPPRYVMYCGNDLNGGSNSLSFNFTASSTVTCRWFRNSTFSWPGTQITATSSSQYFRSEVPATSLTSSTLTVTSPASGDQFFRLEVISGSCTTEYFTTIVDLGVSSPVFEITAAQNICSGSAPGLLSMNGLATAGTGGTTYTYQWQESTNGTSFTDVTGATSVTYQPPSLNADRWYRLGVTITSAKCTGTDYSQAIKITVANNITGNSITAPNCISGAPTISQSGTLSGGSGTFSYIWESSINGTSWTTIPGATAQSYTALSTLVQKTWYRRTVSSGNCNSVSNALEITPAILSNEIPVAQTLCLGSPASAMGPVSPIGGEGPGTYSYQWQSSPDNAGSPSGTWTNVGGNSNTFTPNVASAGSTWYRLVVSSGSCNSTSNESLVTVNALPVIAVSPSASTICSGISVELTASGAATYLWSPSTGLNVTTGSYVVASPLSTTTYTVTGTDGNSCSGTSNVTITVNALPAVPPTNGTSTFAACNPPTGSVNLDNTFISGTPGANEEYRWYTESNIPPAGSPVANPVSSAGTYYAFTYNRTTTCYSATYLTATLNLIDNTTPVPLILSYDACAPATFNLRSIEPQPPSGTSWQWQTGSTYNVANAVLTPGAVGSGTYYLYGVNGTCTTASSSAVGVNINPVPTVTITQSSESACAPNAVDLTNNYSTNTNEIYQWYNVGTNPTPANLITDPGNITSPGTYYLYATNTTTLCQSATPGSVVVSINPRPEITITDPALSCEGSSVNIVGSSNLAATYQWYSVNTATNSITMLTNSSPYNNVTTNILSVNPTTGLSSYLYYLEAVSTSGGCTATADIAPIPLQTPVNCTSQPSGVLVLSLPGSTHFSFSVDDFDANIQWQVSTNGGVNWRNIDDITGNNPVLYSGYNTTRLDILTVNDSMDNFRYRAIASNIACGGCTTSMATLNTPISLPIDGLKLQARRLTDGFQLQWWNLNAAGVAYYEIQFAEDNQKFRTLKYVATGHQPGSPYTATVPPVSGYYRIMAKGIDGSLLYSNVVFMNDGQAAHAGVSPNPVGADGMLNLRISGLQAGVLAECAIYAPEGQLLQKVDLLLSDGDNQLKLSDHVLLRPVVLLKVTHPDQGVIFREKIMTSR